MRKFVSIAASLLFAANLAAAQSFAIDQGSMIIGGTAGFSSQGGDMYESGDDRANSFAVNPELAFFVSPGLAVGGTAVFGYASQGEASQTTIGAGPTIAYLIGNAETTTYPYISVSPLFTSRSTDYGSADFSTTGFGVLGQAGAIVMAARNVGVSFGVYYLYESLSSDDLDESIKGNTYGVEVGITAFVY